MSAKLPANPSVEQLRKRAKDLVKARAAAGQPITLRQAQHALAREHDAASWAELLARIARDGAVAALKAAIDREDLADVRRLLVADPTLHRAPIGYAGAGALTWVAECRGANPPSPARLALAELLIGLGSDVHQDRGAPLDRACVQGAIAMMELLVAHGAEVDPPAERGSIPIYSPCECLDPDVLRWLLDHGADPGAGGRQPAPVDVAIDTYTRELDRQHRCVEMLLAAGAPSRFAGLPNLEIHRGRPDLLAARLAAEPGLARRHFPEFAYGQTGARCQGLHGGTLLHVAAEYVELEAARVLLAHGADVDARSAAPDPAAGPTPIFHAVTQFGDAGVEVARLLVAAGADLTLVAAVRGHYERPDEILRVTPLGYAARFPFARWRCEGAFDLLVAHGAPAGDLYAAARAGYLDEARALIRAGAALDARGPDGDTALTVARRRGHAALAELLAEAGAAESLDDACARGDRAAIERLLARDPSLADRPTGDRRWTPLFHAAANDRVEALDLLRRHGASLGAVDHWERRTPLHRAAERGALGALRWLIAHRAPVDATDWIGWTPLHVAAAAGCAPAVVEELLRAGAERDAVAGGRTPRDLALAHGHAALAELLSR